ncbi:sucrose-6-phosphate hydrolase SacC (GH32 family) [Pseudarthrobacter sp. SLBN-100]
MLPDRTVKGGSVLPWSGRAYELELDISWDAAANVGVSVGRSADGTRHANIGKYGNELYVDRAPSDQAGFSLVPYTRAAAPIDAAARSVHLRILVDTQSVEVFVNAGHTVLSQQVHFADGDTGISLYTGGGPATFSGITIRSFE